MTDKLLCPMCGQRYDTAERLEKIIDKEIALEKAKLSTPFNIAHNMAKYAILSLEKIKNDLKLLKEEEK